MTTHGPSRPDPSEYAAYYGTYIGPVASGNIIELLKAQPTRLQALRSLGDAESARHYAPGKWSVREVIGHMTDAERVFSYRMLRIARGDQTPLASFDQQPYVEAAHFDNFPIAQLVDAFGAARASTLSLVGEIDDDGWRRMGTASGAPVSARALAYIIAGHAAHHTEILRDRYGLTV